MATLGDGFKGIFLAGIGAVAIGAEKGKELVDQLVARGEMTVEQGKQINTELKHRASNLESSIRRDTIEARMSMMSPDERVEFANIVREMADTANAKDAAAAAEKLKAANRIGIGHGCGAEPHRRSEDRVCDGSCRGEHCGGGGRQQRAFRARRGCGSERSAWRCFCRGAGCGSRCR